MVVNNKSANVLKIGVVYPADSVSQLVYGIQMAINEINANTSLLPDATLQFVTRDSAGSILTGTGQTISSIWNDGVVAIIGDGTSDVTEYEAVISGIYNKPHCGLSTAAIELGSATLYPTFFRMMQGADKQTQLFVQFIKSRGWKRFAIMYTSDTFGSGAADAAETAASQLGITVVLKQAFYQDHLKQLARDKTSLIEPLNNLKQSYARIILVLATEPYTVDLYFSAMNSTWNMVGPDYVWMGLNFPGNTVDEIQAIRPDAVRMTQGFITNYGATNAWTPSALAWNQRYRALYGNNINAFDTGTLYEVNTTEFDTFFNTRAAYDVIYLFAIGWTRLLATNASWSSGNIVNGTVPYSPPSVYQSFSYAGAIGQIIWDGNGVVTTYNLIAGNGTNFFDSSELVGVGTSLGVNVNCSGCGFWDFDYQQRVPPDSPTTLDCDPGWEQITFNGQLICAVCPNVCNGNNVHVSVGYWQDPSANMYNRIAFSKSFYFCGPSSGCCSRDPYMDIPCTVGNQCQANFSGILCSACDPGLYEWNGKCVDCTNNTFGSFLLAIYMLGYFLIVVIIYIFPKEAESFLDDLILIVQISSTLLAADGGPSIMSSILKFCALQMNMPFVQNVCLAPIGPFLKMLSGFIIPFLIMFSLLFLLLVTYIIKAIGKGGQVLSTRLLRHLKGNVRNNIYSTTFALALFCFIPTLETAMEILSCQSVGSVSVVRLYPAVTLTISALLDQCWSPEHTGAAAVSINIIVISGLVIPVVALMALRRISPAALPGSTLTLDHTAPYYFLYGAYKLEYHWWLPVDLIERTTIVAISVLLGADDFHRALFLVFIVWFWLLVRIFFMPAKTIVDNSVKIIGYISIIILGGFKLEAIAMNTGGLQAVDCSTYSLAFFILPICILLPMRIFLMLPKRIKFYVIKKCGLAPKVDRYATTDDGTIKRSDRDQKERGATKQQDDVLPGRANSIFDELRLSHENL
ncbi:periplasmic binding protein-like I [Polychytrium aggregatum]|uniref:periplasmic binding protein-like I n=1 Tax=Polychytrium aggregatum TaxID=110093 RepID=UPI0022FF258D|nr:periplasmic binding protein-like I [Polychytrium aggregatum]KAI9209349.1 periplasmic binding protein-like I [Polychytrium aggregatum]